MFSLLLVVGLLSLLDLNFFNLASMDVLDRRSDSIVGSTAAMFAAAATAALGDVNGATSGFKADEYNSPVSFLLLGVTVPWWMVFLLAMCLEVNPWG